MTFLGLGCREPVVPNKPLPATLEMVGSPITGAAVGSMAGDLAVRVKDADGNPLSGVVVTFSVPVGAGQVNPAADTSRADGSASTAFTLGTVPGQNQVMASVSGVAPVKSAVVTGVTGPALGISITPRALRFVASRTSDVVAATSRDSYGNNAGTSVIWASRNSALVSVTPGNANSASVQVVGRPGQTYLVATAAAASDSILVSVLDASSSPCQFAADPTSLVVGGSVTLDNAGFACVRTVGEGAEYVVVATYGTPASTTLAQVEVLGLGIIAPAASSAAAGARSELALDEGPSRDVAFEAGLRQSERSRIGPHVAAARTWYGSNRASVVAVAREGDLAEVNVNAFAFCEEPDLRTARVVAITSSAVILADTSNPPGGFTDEEYRAFGVAMDTLVVPADTAAFGAPTDIDGNGRVAILFSVAVNQLTPRASTGGIALGFFYSRDLLPKESAIGACPGSNVREMFYVLVPDPAGTASDARSKAFVQSVVVTTLAHEYQHLINSSRRLYVNKTPSANEEVWLNEGLSHIAEELVFYRSSNLIPRQNIGPAQLQSGSSTRTSFDSFVRGNFSRYLQYLRAPELNSPIAQEDALATRGAIWAFLRYLADRWSASDGNFWHRLANSQLTGVANVEAALGGTGLTMLGTMRDWSISVVLDDNPPATSGPFQQPSWNFVLGLPAVGLNFGLTQAILASGFVRPFPLRAAGSSYMRFGVAENQEALIQGTGAAGTPIPPGVRLTVVRTR